MLLCLLGSSSGSCHSGIGVRIGVVDKGIHQYTDLSFVLQFLHYYTCSFSKFRNFSVTFSIISAFFLVCFTQQAEALKMHTDLKVGMYWGDMGVDFWDSSTWKQEVDKYEVSFSYFDQLDIHIFFWWKCYEDAFHYYSFSSPFISLIFIKSCLAASQSLMICHHIELVFPTIWR